jgi:hypothetical protein
MKYSLENANIGTGMTQITYWNTKAQSEISDSQLKTTFFPFPQF